MTYIALASFVDDRRSVDSDVWPVVVAAQGRRDGVTQALLEQHGSTRCVDRVDRIVLGRDVHHVVLAGRDAPRVVDFIRNNERLGIHRIVERYRMQQAEPDPPLTFSAVNNVSSFVPARSQVIVVVGGDGDFVLALI